MSRGYIPKLDHEIIRLDFGQKGSQNDQSKIHKDFGIDLSNNDIKTAKQMSQKGNNGYQAIYNLRIIPC